MLNNSKVNNKGTLSGKLIIDSGATICMKDNTITLSGKITISGEDVTIYDKNNFEDYTNGKYINPSRQC